MKEFRITITIFSIILAAWCVCLVKDLPAQTPKEELYALTTVVTEVNESTDTVVCVDATGNEWEFDGVEDWSIGDIASLAMNDKGTPEIYDDEIINVKYGGWMDFIL